MWTRLSSTPFCSEGGGDEYAEEEGSCQAQADEASWPVAPLTPVPDFEGKRPVRSHVLEYKATVPTTSSCPAEQRGRLYRRQITHSERLSQAQHLFKHEAKQK